MAENLAQVNEKENTFLVFVCDAVSYTLRLNGMEWSLPPLDSNYRKKFQDVFGRAVFCFRDRHRAEFFDRVCEYEPPAFDGVGNFQDFVVDSVDRIFKGKVILMEIVVYCAFLSDLVILCLQSDYPELIHDAVDSAVSAWRYVKPYFEVVGGWYALFRVAEQYMEYISLKTKFSVLENKSSPPNCPDSSHSSDQSHQ